MRKLAVIATIGLFLVVMMGSTVTSTGSAAGCGGSWPLCHGEFIPGYALETAIEFSHRLITGLEGFLILGAAAGTIWVYPGRRDVKILSAIMVGTIALQSGLGAMAVLWPQSPAVLATHFGVSLACLAAAFLPTRLMFDYGSRSPRTRLRCQPGSGAPPGWPFPRR